MRTAVDRSQMVRGRFLAAFLAASLAMIGPALKGQDKIYRPRPNYVQIGKPDQAEGRRILEEFRSKGLAGDMYLEIDLRVMPRRSDGWTVPARLWMGRDEKGPVCRLELQPGDEKQACRLIVQSGPESAVWRWQPVGSGQKEGRLGLEALFAPLAGTDMTPFDLQMPFLYWSDFVFEGVARVLGRPAHVFLMYPPAEVSKFRPELCGVRVYLDTQFNALVQAEQLGRDDVVLKSITLLDLKKVGGQWVPKTIDVRNDATRNKTRFAVRRAATGLDLLPGLFDPGSLGTAAEPPAGDELQDVGP